jgi:hypothetical protein
MSEEEKPETIEEKMQEEKDNGVDSEDEIVPEMESEEDSPDKEDEVMEEEIFYEDAVNKGDFIYIEMTGKVEETNEVFETTEEETAKESGIFKEENVYGPRLVIVGDGFVLRGLDDKLPGIKFDEEIEIEVPSSEALRLMVDLLLLGA